MEIASNVWIDWLLTAEKLYILSPNSTMWDLFVVMYEKTTGNEFPVLESDESINRIFALHALGNSPKKISRETGIPKTAVITYLKSCGFSPWRNSLNWDTVQLVLDYGVVDQKELKEKYQGISYYMINKILKEMKKYELYRDAVA